jgi:hypothetical protein
LGQLFYNLAMNDPHENVVCQAFDREAEVEIAERL